MAEPTPLLERTEKQSRFAALKLAEAEASSRVELAADALLGAVAFDMAREKVLEGAASLSNALEVLRSIRETLGEMLVEDVAKQLESTRGLL